MPGWLQVVLGLVVLISLFALLLVLLAARRRWLDRFGGTFECSVRLRVTTPGAGYGLGVARYSEGALEWFRYFSFSLRPRVAFRRGTFDVLDTREPTPVEALALSTDQRIVLIESTEVAAPEGWEWELAMSPESLTGLLSWLEAAPPGVRTLDW
jgi:Protein of unknown function (DUF2550)